jgi:tetratricopeptide (TPR) repeat protein
VDARQRWQALQAHLSAARSFLEAGDRAKALEEVNAALAIDPAFLAAQSLRDGILAPSPAVMSLPVAPSAPPPSRPLVSTEGYARFEERARRRRADRKIEAARNALARGRLRDAAAALDEVIELDPNLPELSDLTAQFDALRRATATAHRGPWLAAAAVFAAVVLGATWLEESRSLPSNPISAEIGLINPESPATLVAWAIAEGTVTPGTTTGERDLDLASGAAPSTKLVDTTVVGSPPSRPPAVQAEPRMAPSPAVDVAPPAVPQTHAAADAVDVAPAAKATPPENPVSRATLENRSPSESRASLEIPAPRSTSENGGSRGNPQSVSARAENLVPPVTHATLETVVTPRNDELLVKQALQRYRAAYEGLDAGSARAVWPAVNEAALARAFNGLASQTLTFDACDVQLRGEEAKATCRGSARYVTKIGSREPRIEPLVWNFTLRKLGSDWTIENARAAR